MPSWCVKAGAFAKRKSGAGRGQVTSSLSSFVGGTFPCRELCILRVAHVSIVLFLRSVCLNVDGKLPEA